MAQENCPFNAITPYAQSDVLNTPNIFNLNYTNQDFWSMKTRLIDFIKQKFATNFNDFVESSIAIMLIENWAFLADTLSFKIDQIANEIFIDTVTEIDNAFRLAKLVGFQPQPPIAARSLWTASLNNPILTDVGIPAPYTVTVQSGTSSINIELFPADANNNPIFNQDIVIPAGNIANSAIIGLQGKTYTEQFQGTGAVGQTFTLTFFPAIWDSVSVVVDGVGWTQVDFFTDSQPRREFRVEFDSNYVGYIIFGNGRAGLVPSNGSSISATYRQGGGSIGNIVTGTITDQTVANVPGLGYSVPVSFHNYTNGEYGYDGDTIDDIRQKLPAWIQTQFRAVTGNDYKILADQFATPYNGQIGKATAVLRNYGCAGNIIDIYVLSLNAPNDLTDASNELKTALIESLADNQMFTDFVCVRDGNVVLVDATIDVTMDKLYRKFQDEFTIKIQRRIDSFFALNNWDYGQTLRDVDLIKRLSDLTEVTSYDINFVTNDSNNSGRTVTTQFNEIIRPDTVTIAFTFE